MALLAATSLGGGHVESIRARVRADALPELSGGLEEPYRLIVQSYEPGTIGSDSKPLQSARPIASTQRSVTASELRKGLVVDLLHVTDGLPESGRRVVVAWVERGQPNLEFDARQARPGPDAAYGVAQAGRRPARLILRHPMVAA